MEHTAHLKTSFIHLWENPSLLGVMLLQFVLSSLLVLLFVLIDIVIVVAINGINLETISVAQPEAFIAQIMNPHTLIIGGILLVIEALFLTYVISFFTAGSYGMIKNVIKDGSTTFNEFLPEAKRFWHPLFWFMLIRYGILFVAALPFIAALVMFLGTTPEFIGTPHIIFLISSVIITAFVWLLTFFWLIYGEAVIVFEDAGPVQAIKRTVELVRANAWHSVKVIFWAFLVMVAAAIIEAIFTTPLQLAVEATGSAALGILSNIVDLLFNIVTVAVGIVVSIFIFRSYCELTGARTRTAPVARVAVKKVARKR